MCASCIDSFNIIHFLPLPLEVGGTVEGCAPILSCQCRRIEKKVYKKISDLMLKWTDKEVTRSYIYQLIISRGIEVADTIGF